MRAIIRVRRRCQSLKERTGLLRCQHMISLDRRLTGHHRHPVQKDISGAVSAPVTQERRHVLKILRIHRPIENIRYTAYQDGIFPKRLHFKPHPGKKLQVLHDAVIVSRTQRNGFRLQEDLRVERALVQDAANLIIQNPLMRRMLIHDIQHMIRLRHPIGRKSLTN